MFSLKHLSQYVSGHTSFLLTTWVSIMRFYVIKKKKKKQSFFHSQLRAHDLDFVNYKLFFKDNFNITKPFSRSFSRTSHNTTISIESEFHRAVCNKKWKVRGRIQPCYCFEGIYTRGTRMQVPFTLSRVLFHFYFYYI